MKSRWFIKPKPNPRADVRLICFPYAGGNASTYAPWADMLPEDVELVAIQPPGRSSRISEKLIYSMDEMVDGLCGAGLPLIDKPYVIFGHSLGSRIALEFMKRLMLFSMPMPVHYIASGSRAPHIAIQDKRLSELPEKEFMSELRVLNGTPEIVLKNQKLMELCVPILRADFSIGDNYCYQSATKFACNASVFNGLNDQGITGEQLSAWQQHFLPTLQFESFSGDHFFIDSSRRQVLECINKILASVSENYVEVRCA